MKKRILVTPLDWGLGHATRCIPIIQELLAQGADVLLASNGGAFELLRKEFPELVIEKLPAYNIHYASGNMYWNMGVQLPKIARAIISEYFILQRLIRQHQINAVISDNRYGCFSKKAKSIFITHQLNILIPNFILRFFANFFNCQFIRRFDECWIPDESGEKSLSGKLSISYYHIKVKYIGILSRMNYLQVQKKYDIIIILSGPEPQRTILEKIILEQIVQLPLEWLLVQGKLNEDEEARRRKGRERGSIIPFLNAKALNKAIAVSEIVICRSGYSSIMDLAMLGKKAILIPTPGQTEQEYLAERFSQKSIFYSQQQTRFNLRTALQEAQHYSGLPNNIDAHSQQKLKKIIRNFLESL
ncbi:MAG: glycosyltransferase [Saprospiraceae bacterium]|nr:glycosyltransferase [Saprospiraceae bacterium]